MTLALMQNSALLLGTTFPIVVGSEAYPMEIPVHSNAILASTLVKPLEYRERETIIMNAIEEPVLYDPLNSRLLWS
ncbi:hypothetical protein BS47DRAFT_1341683 [Hydnum rufescens UP504]|uniref:Uncharacterized protein n=1 Tax=Hydnum rufescens UP504 TaxID=1448309 RepID=A0A9P6B145_9AGAM|nr:hypothetical protein BS47DRAFT_1341683 [Hydnum rufescens UP504]